MADVATDNPARFPRRVRHLLLSPNRTSFHRFRTDRSFWVYSNQNRTWQRSSHIAVAIRAAIPRPEFLSDVPALFARDQCIDQCISAELQTRDGSAAFTEHPGGIAQRLDGRGGLRRHPGHSPAAFSLS